jgi:hypothetical protein
MKEKKWLSRKAFLLIASAASMLTFAGGAIPTAAYANAQVDACPQTTTWGFSPALNLIPQAGSINASYQGLCGSVVYSNTYDTWITENAGGASWSGTYLYTGTCELASFAYGYNYSTGQYEGSGLLVGETLSYALAGNSNYSPSAYETEVDVLAVVPLPCNPATLTGASQEGFAALW